MRKSTLGKQGAASATANGAQGSNPGFFTPLMPGALPGVAPCPSGYLPAPSAFSPGMVCVRAPGSYTVRSYFAGRR